MTMKEIWKEGYSLERSIELGEWLFKYGDIIDCYTEMVRGQERKTVWIEFVKVFAVELVDGEIRYADFFCKADDWKEAINKYRGQLCEEIDARMLANAY